MANEQTNKAQIPEQNTKIKLWVILGLAAFAALCCILLIFSPVGDDQVFPVYITEIMASNTSYPNIDGRCCDYIEIHNSASYAVDLTGFKLGDIDGSARYNFPSGTVIEAGGYLVIYCDKTAESGSYAPFGISRSGDESFYLIGSNNAIVDSVVTMAMDPDEAMILQQDGQWGLSYLATPGRANDDTASVGQDQFNEAVSPVRLTEFSAANTGYVADRALACDWVELQNTSDQAVDISGFILSDNMGNDKFRFPAGTELGPGGYRVVYCSKDSRWEDIAPFGLSQLGGEMLILKNAQGMVIEILQIAAGTETGSAILTEDGSWTATERPSPGFENTEAGHSLFLESIGAQSGSVVISEVMTGDQLVLADANGSFSDWVELYNPGTAEVDLSGWYLSDDLQQPGKWTFPDLQIGAGQRVLIFCSGQGAVIGGQIHTDFSLASGGESLVLSSYLGNAVDSITVGKAGSNSSFVCDSGEPVICPLPTPGYENTEEGYAQLCASQQPAGPLAIWEVMTSNDTYLPQALGECYDWVELRNISNAPVQLSQFSLTDDPDEPGRFLLPDRTLEPGQSVAVILSGDESLSTDKYAHAGFALSAAEDQLLLYGSNGALVDYVFLKGIPAGKSYGRQEGTGGFFYQDPTPLKDNKTGFRLISGEPVSQTAAGVYSSDAPVTLSLEAAGSIYYTTDGSEPDASCTPYTGPVTIGETTVLRAVSIEPGKLGSDIFTVTYIIGQDHSLPVVSLVTDPDNLWGPGGMYRNNDITVKELKRGANVAYCGEDGSFSLDCELSLHGNTSVLKKNKKSFKLGFQDSYDGALNYDVFEDGAVTRFRSLAIRTAYEDVYSTQMRDALAHDIASRYCDTLICQKYKFAALYLNGEYWGLYAIRETHTEEHYATYMEVPASTVSVIKTYIEPDTALYPIFLQCKNGSLRSTKSYEEVTAILDVESFADWVILQSYTSNVDLTSNVRYYYSSADGLWRCGLVDVDYGMLYGQFDFKGVATCFHHGEIVSDLMAYPEFQELLAKRTAELLKGPLSDERMLAAIDAMAAQIRDEIPRERARWGSDAQQWEYMVEWMKQFCDGRAEEMVDGLCGYLGFSQEQREAYFGDL